MGCIVWRKGEKPELRFLSFQGIKYNTGHVIYLQDTRGRWHLEPSGHRGQSVLLSGKADYKSEWSPYLKATTASGQCTITFLTDA